MSGMPAIEYERAPCPACGKVTIGDDAICRPTTDQTGERSCPGDTDDDQYILQPTAASLAALDRWIDEVASAEADQP